MDAPPAIRKSGRVGSQHRLAIIRSNNTDFHPGAIVDSVVH